jgi:hypothetical protein
VTRFFGENLIQKPAKRTPSALLLYEIADFTKALSFAIDGKQVFATRVNLPAVTVPERSYLRSSLAEMADEIREELTAAAMKAVR